MVHIERPVGLKAVLEALAQPDTGALAGGTNVMVDIKKKTGKTASICIHRYPG